jgi:mono/diheme cytochrome c family protein
LLATIWLTSPQTIDPTEIPAHEPDLANGELVFWTGGCASCHATPIDGKRAMGDDKLLLGGGLELDTPYGIFRAPNISPSEEFGIGSWRAIDFLNAMQRGVSPDGRHYYPSFPYTSYVRMAAEDILDLQAYLNTLPAIEEDVAEHTLSFPWNMRRGIGAWKRLYLDDAAIVATSSDSTVTRGQYLVEGPGHCGECHSPRNKIGGMRHEQWLAGAPNLDGAGRIPNITPAGKNVASWSRGDLVYYFESGFTPDFDTTGGSMVAVQENLAKLPRSDLEAIAAYLQSIPALGAKPESP